MEDSQILELFNHAEKTLDTHSHLKLSYEGKKCRAILKNGNIMNLPFSGEIPKGYYAQLEYINGLYYFLIYTVEDGSIVFNRYEYGPTLRYIRIHLL